MEGEVTRGGGDAAGFERGALRGGWRPIERKWGKMRVRVWVFRCVYIHT